MVAVTSWGRIAYHEHIIQPLYNRHTLVEQISGARQSALAFGNGRSYGDVGLNPKGVLWPIRGLDRMISFDVESGILICEAGVLLRDIQRLVVPQGWMLPVTPGTQLVTVGGSIANDIHGKNHHKYGSFGDNVRQLRLVRTDGDVIDCGPHLRPDWFSATVGGIGLTGVIVRAELQLRPVAGPWLDTESIPFETLEDFFCLSDSSEAEWEHTVSWVDCVSGGGGRGVFMRGNHSDSRREAPALVRPKSMPFTPPFSLVNGFSLRAFNELYYRLGKWKAGKAQVHYEPFFYPLDNLLEWNRMYGPRGFWQYQCCIPRDVGHNAVQAMLKEIARSGSGSFLAVLKTFGNQHPLGMLSFPRPGVTLALDFPNKAEKTERLFKRLDAIVAEANGHIYLAKDGRQPKALFQAGYPCFNKFLSYRDGGLSSAMSHRLMDL